MAVVPPLVSFLLTLTNWSSTGQVFCGMSLDWDLFDVFLRTRVGLWVSGRKNTEVTCHSYHIISRVHALNMTCPCWRWPQSPAIGSACQVSLLCHTHPLSSLPPGCSPHLRSGKSCSASLIRENSHKLLGILCCGRFVYSPQLMYLIIYLHQYGLVNIILYLGL